MKENKNIIIVTFNKAHNFGAMLQEYALQEIVSKILSDVKVLNYQDKNIAKQYKLLKIETKNIKVLIKSLASSIIFFCVNLKRCKAFEKFEKDNIKLTKKYKDSDLKKIEDNADIYITGSDQVWNADITKGVSDVYSLNFGPKNIKRISYAASIGNNKIEENYERIYKEKLSKIDRISVREETGKKALSKILDNKEIDVVLDPTLLLTQEEWKKKTESVISEKEKYILAYDLVEENVDYRKIVEKLSEETGLKIVHFEKRNKFRKNVLKSAYSEGPMEFVNLIKNAEYTVVTSFHGTVFSILFNKKTWVIPPKKTGSRVVDLLNKVKMTDRIVFSLEEFNKKNYDEEIDYESVNKKLEEERKKSINWLEKAINS